MTYKEFMLEGWEVLTEDKEQLAVTIATIAVMLFCLLVLATFLAIIMGTWVPYVAVLGIFVGALFITSAGYFIFGSVYWFINRKDM